MNTLAEPTWPYLELAPDQTVRSTENYSQSLVQRLKARSAALSAESIAQASAVFDLLQNRVEQAGPNAESKPILLSGLGTFVGERMDSATNNEFEAWDEAQLFIDSERQRDEVFKQPGVLNYISELQAYLGSLDVVGKSSSVADVVKTVHRELLLGKDEAFRIPDSANAVAQTLITYQNSHRPHDLWHFITPDYRKATLLVQLTSGDNQDMASVEKAVNGYFLTHSASF